MGQGETALAQVKVTLQKDLENLSRDGSVPLDHLCLGFCPGEEHGQKAGQPGCSTFHRSENKRLRSRGTQTFGVGKKTHI